MPIKAKHNGSYKDITDLMNVDESIDYVLAKTSSSYKRVYTATRSIEDAPPTTFKSIKPGANLTDYRIYGQTSRNLLDENSLISPISSFTWYFDDEHYLLATNTSSDNRPWAYSQSQFHIALPAGTYTLRLSGVGANSQYSEIQVFKSNGDLIDSENIAGKSNIVITFTLNTSDTIGIEIKLYNGKYRFMLNEGTVPLPYEPYGESVGDRTGNLCENSISGVNISSNGFIYADICNDVGYAKVVAGETYTINSYVYAFFEEEPKERDRSYDNGRVVGTSPSTFEAPINGYVAFRTESGSQLQCNEGNNLLPYEPYGYRVAVTVTNDNNSQTTNLYLPEQIRKVRNAAEYIDYGEQKFVKKFYKMTLNFDDMNNDEIFPGWSGGTAVVEYCNKIRSSAIDYPDSYQPLQYSSISDFKANFNVRNNNSILYLGASFVIGRTQSELKEIYAGQSITFILKIPDTDLNVTLPALPTLPGTNMLSVGTEVQPSKIDITGHIKTISGGS